MGNKNALPSGQRLKSSDNILHSPLPSLVAPFLVENFHYPNALATIISHYLPFPQHLIIIDRSGHDTLGWLSSALPDRKPQRSSTIHDTVGYRVIYGSFPIWPLSFLYSAILGDRLYFLINSHDQPLFSCELHDIIQSAQSPTIPTPKEINSLIRWKRHSSAPWVCEIPWVPKQVIWNSCWFFLFSNGKRFYFDPAKDVWKETIFPQIPIRPQSRLQRHEDEEYFIDQKNQLWHLTQNEFQPFKMKQYVTTEWPKGNFVKGFLKDMPQDSCYESLYGCLPVGADLLVTSYVDPLPSWSPVSRTLEGPQCQIAICRLENSNIRLLQLVDTKNEKVPILAKWRGSSVIALKSVPWLLLVSPEVDSFPCLIPIDTISDFSTYRWLPRWPSADVFMVVTGQPLVSYFV